MDVAGKLVINIGEESDHYLESRVVLTDVLVLTQLQDVLLQLSPSFAFLSFVLLSYQVPCYFSDAITYFVFDSFCLLE